MTFYLQNGLPDNAEGIQEPRTFLDEYVHPGCAALNGYEAETWIEARAQVPL